VGATVPLRCGGDTPPEFPKDHNDNESHLVHRRDQYLVRDLILSWIVSLRHSLAERVLAELL
jgi:hypothetical protein